MLKYRIDLNFSFSLLIELISRPDVNEIFHSEIVKVWKYEKVLKNI